MKVHRGATHMNRPKTAPLRQYEVVRKLDIGESSTCYYARTRGSAIYQSFLDWRDTYPDIKFMQFRKRVSARLVPEWPTGCYSFVKQHYGVEVDAGDRVQACGRTGIVIPHTQYNYVHFVPDGTNSSVAVHPYDVKVIERRAGA